MTNGLEIIQQFEQFAAPSIAEDWDHVGLQLGDPSQPVKKVLTTLDVRPAVVDEAIRLGANFIFSHHPLMFRPAKDLDLRQPQNAMYAKLLRHGITVYSAHTNLDTANGGMNDWLAAQLELTNLTGLVPAGKDPVSEQPVAMGRVGDLPKPLSPTAFVDWVQKHFAVKGLRYVLPDPAPQTVQRVAILGGSGGDFYRQAKAAGAQAYVTGDVSYHVAQDMQASGLMLVDPGHHIEVVAALKLQALLKSWATEKAWTCPVVVSQVNTEPFNFQMKG